MRIAYLAAGAANMYCGSCMRDNRLAATLLEQGRDVVFMPLYTPLRTDEPDATNAPIHYGGVNVYLQQKSALFRTAPAFVDRLLDSPALLRSIGRFAASTRAADLGDLTLSVLDGEHGAQRKELEKLVAALRRIRPDRVHLPNLFFAGMAPRLKAALGVPVLCTLSGEDLFLDGLDESHREPVRARVGRQAAAIDAFVAVTRYYGERAARLFGLDPSRIHHVPMGIRVSDVGPAARPGSGPFTIGYLARICAAKGLRPLCEAVVRLQRSGRDCRLRAAGYLGAGDRGYFEEVQEYLRNEGLLDRFEYLGEVTRAQKFEFLRSLHALSVPTVYPEAKGLYLLEAKAVGVPVVQPRHSAFTELIEATGGGLLCEPDDPASLADSIARLIDDPELRRGLGERGRLAVHERFNDAVMAAGVWALYERVGTGSSR